jgi:Fur family ferric uptake transcriptional regulator
MGKTLLQLLKNHDLRVTPVRLTILEYFENQNNAMSHADLEHHFKEHFDRVTIYRTLQSFLEKGLLHKVPDDTGIARYAFCRNDCSSHHHVDNHVHFKCQVCKKVECIHTLQIPILNVPSGYKVNTANLLMEGICLNCND